MRGVAEQRDAAVRPARQRIAVAQRIFPEFGVASISALASTKGI